jgi:hypothetical protein
MTSRWSTPLLREGVNVRADVGDRHVLMGNHWWLVAGPRRRLQARSSVRGRDETGCCSPCVARDLYEGGVLSSSVNVAASRPGLLIRDGMDLDELDVDLRGYKAILAIYPQGRLALDASPMTFTFGVTDYPAVAPVFGLSQTYNAREDYKCDFTDAGRFLSMKMDYPDYKTMSLSGIDVDLDVLGQR